MLSSYLVKADYIILSHVHNRLSADTTRGLLCLNNWIGQGLVKLEDLKEAASLPEVLDEIAEEEQDEFNMVFNSLLLYLLQ